MNKNKNHFTYETSAGSKSGFFDIYQSRNGSIMLQLGYAFTRLSYKQIERLRLDVYILKDFDHDAYVQCYQNEI
ncbi:hypothetical protein [Pedobacter nutrimenti]|uniref:hypothetical protein n=1 Tax=Pedobacter nutrimenti TaxID=1241337 RepID=UPI00292FEE0C|nr:hypothetical protein [Pedobacter nutrimenti]